MKAIQSGQKLTSRSICDAECIFTLTVIERKGNFATINYMGATKRVKIRVSDDCEYIKPDSYSMAPIFRAN
jgi:hypothetical protein